ncbi:MAG: hypothetical protein Q9169_002977 [Polycauliona sp. 2 TL-2023]
MQSSHHSIEKNSAHLDWSGFAMAAAISALNAKIRSQPTLSYFCSTHFWGPFSNFGIPIAAILDTQKDPELGGGREEALKMKAQQATQTTKTEGQKVLQQAEEKGKGILQQGEAKVKEVKEKLVK